MANLEDIKKKLIETAEVIADVSVDLYKQAEEKTQVLAKTTKLRAENASDRTTLKKLYQALGKAYFETHRLFPEAELEQNCLEIATTLERIVERNELIELIKSGVEYEETCDCGCEDDDDEEDEDEAEATDAEPEIEIEIVVESTETDAAE